MGTGQNPRRGNGDGDGLNYVPVPVPIPERGLIFLPVPVPVPVPVVDGHFSPLRGGAPAGTGIPQLFVIPNHYLIITFNDNIVEPDPNC